jgi:hypothetical protein
VLISGASKNPIHHSTGAFVYRDQPAAGPIPRHAPLVPVQALPLPQQQRQNIQVLRKGATEYAYIKAGQGFKWRAIFIQTKHTIKNDTQIMQIITLNKD